MAGRRPQRIRGRTRRPASVRREVEVILKLPGPVSRPIDDITTGRFKTVQRNAFRAHPSHTHPLAWLYFGPQGDVSPQEREDKTREMFRQHEFKVRTIGPLVDAIAAALCADPSLTKTQILALVESIVPPARGSKAAPPGDPNEVLTAYEALRRQQPAYSVYGFCEDLAKFFGTSLRTIQRRLRQARKNQARQN